MIQPQEQNLKPERQSPVDSPVETSDTSDLKQRIERIGSFSVNILRSMPLLRLIGYGFLILFCFDLLEILVPPRLLNPQWEFQVMGQLVERVAIPFIGLLLIFYGGNYLRSRWEVPLLKILSWLTLIAGIVYLLLVPLGITNTIRIYRQSNAAIEKQVEQRVNVLQQVQTRLNEVQSEEQMQQLLGQLTNRPNIPDIENTEQVEEIRGNLSEFIDTSKTRIDTQAEAARKQRRNALFKSSIKWNLGSLVSGFLFITAWRLTKWARVPEKVKQK